MSNAAKMVENFTFYGVFIHFTAEKSDFSIKVRSAPENKKMGDRLFSV